MTVLETHVRRDSAEFKQNESAYQSLLGTLRDRLRVVQAGGGSEAEARHRSRNKLLARERIDLLLDPGSPFLEFSALAAWEMYDGEAPSAGIVTGIGAVSGQEVVVVANDATVKGGTYFPMTVKKHPAGTGNRPAEPAAVRLPGGLGRRVPSAAGRSLPR